MSLKERGKEREREREREIAEEEESWSDEGARVSRKETEMESSLQDTCKATKQTCPR